MRNKLLMAVLTLAVLALVSTPAQADPLLFTITNASQVGAQGTVLTFSATTSNGTSPADPITINGSSFSFPNPADPNLSLDDTEFFLNFDGQTIASGDSIGPMPIFTISIGPGTTPNVYTGSFTIFWDSMSGGGFTTQDFNVTVLGSPPQAVPEPATLILLATGLFGVLSVRRLHHQQTN